MASSGSVSCLIVGSSCSALANCSRMGGSTCIGNCLYMKPNQPHSATHYVSVWAPLPPRPMLRQAVAKCNGFESMSIVNAHTSDDNDNDVADDNDSDNSACWPWSLLPIRFYFLVIATTTATTNVL